MSLARKKVTRSNAVCLAAFLFGAGFTVNAAPGVEATAATNSPSGQIQTVHLEYSEAGYGFINWGLPLVTRSTPFAKEPAFAGGKVIRGTFQPGGSASNAIAFAWDWSAGKLYLDLNRNLNLTDDPAGVFGCQEKNHFRYYQTFANVRLPFKTRSGNRELLVDLNLYNYGTQPDCTAAVRSFWQGKMNLQGTDQQVGIVEHSFDKLDSPESGYLLLRPWAERNKPFNTQSGSLDAAPFSRKLFLQNQAYQLDCTNESPGDSSRLRLQFTGQQPAMGELKISGKFIQRLVLPGGPYLVVLDQPAASMRVPTGSYNSPDIRLKQNGAEAFCNSGQSPAGRQISVTDKAPAVLNVGGPLTNSVIASRHGQDLRLDYRLTGMGGETYQMANQDRSHPPQFAIYKGDKKMASGAFEFG